MELLGIMTEFSFILPAQVFAVPNYARSEGAYVRMDPMKATAAVSIRCLGEIINGCERRVISRPIPRPVS
jgi:hypothetical protein